MTVILFLFHCALLGKVFTTADVGTGSAFHHAVSLPSIYEDRRMSESFESGSVNPLQPHPPVISPLPSDELQYHGTTTLAFKFKHGIIVAVDSRASIGKYVGSRTTRKAFPISRHVLATMAGGAADCTYWIRLCTRISKLHEYTSGVPLSVESIATMLAKRLREMKQASKSVKEATN